MHPDPKKQAKCNSPVTEHIPLLIIKNGNSGQIDQPKNSKPNSTFSLRIEVGEQSSAHLTPFPHRGIRFMIRASGHFSLKLLQNATHCICILSALGARSPLGARGHHQQYLSSNGHSPVFSLFYETRRDPATRTFTNMDAAWTSKGQVRQVHGR